MLCVAAVQYLTELRISLQRIDKFLSMPEPPPPVHHRATANAAAGAARAAAAAAAIGGVTAAAAAPVGVDDEHLSVVLPMGTVALRGADYDWNSNVQIDVPHSLDSHKDHKGKDQHSKEADNKSKPPPAAAAGEEVPSVGSVSSSNGQGSSGKAVVNGNSSSSGPTGGPTLKGIRLEVNPGELLGVVGEVGSGKSSLLAALLGELQPLRGPEGSAAGESKGGTGGEGKGGGVAMCGLHSYR